MRPESRSSERHGGKVAYFVQNIFDVINHLVDDGTDVAWRRHRIRTASAVIRSRSRGCSASRVVMSTFRPSSSITMRRIPDKFSNEKDVGVVIDENVDVAFGVGLVAGRRTEQIKRRGALCSNGIDVFSNAENNVISVHDRFLLLRSIA